MKLNEITNQRAEIEALLKKYKIENYTIHLNGTVDVDDDVELSEEKFESIPFKFGIVTGNFSCWRCPDLTSLKGAPSSVGGYFSCGSCANLSSLVGAPSSVVGYFSCGGCINLTSLEGFGTHVSRTIYCDWETIKFGGISLVLSGTTNLYEPAGPFLIIEQYLKRPDDIFECQAELIEAGYGEYAKL